MLDLESIRLTLLVLSIALVSASTIIAMAGQTHKNGRGIFSLNRLGQVAALCLGLGVFASILETILGNKIEEKQRIENATLQAELNAKTDELITLTTEPRIEVLAQTFNDQRQFQLGFVGRSEPRNIHARRVQSFRYQVQQGHSDVETIYVIDDIGLDAGTRGYGVFNTDRGLEPGVIYVFDHESIGSVPEMAASNAKINLEERSSGASISISVAWESCVHLEFEDTFGEDYDVYMQFGHIGGAYTSEITSRYEFELCSIRLDQAQPADDVIRYDIPHTGSPSPYRPEFTDFVEVLTAAISASLR